MHLISSAVSPAMLPLSQVPRGLGFPTTGALRGVFQKYAERFHRMFAIAARLMIFHVKHAWFMLIEYR